MAKTKSKRSRHIESAIKKIEDHYSLGKLILKECGPTAPHGLIAQLAKQHRIGRDTARKLRAMAAKDTGYTKTELNQWFKLFREEDHALTISHFAKLLSIPKGSQRDELTTEAVNNRWSSHRLQSEILARHGRRRAGGRKPTVICGDLFEAELKQKMWAWKRWLELHLDANQELRPEISKELKAIKKKIAKVDTMLS
ncbi:hypothetical protein OAH34_02770 [bacterium]|nr:hypothetical protein [bacterium]